MKEQEINKIGINNIAIGAVEDNKKELRYDSELSILVYGKIVEFYLDLYDREENNELYEPSVRILRKNLLEIMDDECALDFFGYIIFDCGISLESKKFDGEFPCHYNAVSKIILDNIRCYSIFNVYASYSSLRDFICSLVTLLGEDLAIRVIYHCNLYNHYVVNCLFSKDNVEDTAKSIDII